jgi:hypothetical protein
VADDRERAAVRAMKLLRTAASPGASENERQVAALHAAQLIDEHELSVVADEKEVERKARERAERKAKFTADTIAEMLARMVKNAVQPSGHVAWTPLDWHEVVAERHERCGQCREVIPRGSACWFAENKGYIHHDITCAEGRSRRGP